MNPSMEQAGQSGGYLSLGFGIIFLVLGYFVAQRSRTALWISIILYALDLLTLVLAALGGHAQFISGIFLHAAFLWIMYQGFQGMDVLDYETYALTSQPTARSLNPATDNNAQVMIARASLLLKTGGDKHEAQTLIDRALQLDPNNLEGLYLKGYIAPSTEEKMAALQQVLAISPGHRGALIALVRLREGHDMPVSFS